MQKIKYQVIGFVTVTNEETGEAEQRETLATVEMVLSEEAEAHAREVAVGEVVIYDDGESTSVEPSTNDIINAMLGVK